MPSDRHRLTMELAPAVFATVDWQMGQAVSSAICTDDGPREDRADEIRTAGEMQVASAGRAWPPTDQAVSLTLTLAQWSFVLKELEDTDELMSSRLASGEGAEHVAAAIAAIEQQLRAATAPASRPLSSDERAVLEHLLSFDFAGVVELRQQAAHVVVARPREGDLLSVDLEVRGATVSAPVPDGPAPVEGWVYDDDQVLLGTVLLWVEDGRLSGLEYGWVTDNPPRVWPAARQISLRT